MQKKYKSLGLMSGTSGDGVDASIIISNGRDDYESIYDKYFQYDDKIYKKIHELKDKINNSQDLKKLSKDIKDLERKITLFHAKLVKDLDIKFEDYLVGFHGQTIYHNSKEKKSIQLGDAKLLYQLLKKKIVYNFRSNDLFHNGEGAPLTPIFHQLIVSKNKIDLPVCVLNIGGISNITIINKSAGSEELISKDIGPGNCLIDSWVRKNSKEKFDKNGNFAKRGEKNEIIIEQAQELYENRKNKEKLSFDVNDFDISFARGLSLPDGAKTLTDFTAGIIGSELNKNIVNYNNEVKNILVCGGGRKNQILMEEIKKNLKKGLKLLKIDNFKVNGDFIESQAFAFLAIRRINNLPISFPSTTGCSQPCIGGDLVEN